MLLQCQRGFKWKDTDVRQNPKAEQHYFRTIFGVQDQISRRDRLARLLAVGILDILAVQEPDCTQSGQAPSLK